MIRWLQAEAWLSVMSQLRETSDAAILDLLREADARSVSELATATKVTATAVRQRLVRLMRQGLVEREPTRHGRGRPRHRYLLSEKAKRQAGENFTDLALVLWKEIRGVQDPQVRKGLYRRIAQNMAGMYGPQVNGATTAERMQQVASVLGERNVPFVVEQQEQQLPVLTAHACPYPELAEQDRGICVVERMMLAELLASDVRLRECRMDGDTCCRFTTN